MNRLHHIFTIGDMLSLTSILLCAPSSEYYRSENLAVVGSLVKLCRFHMAIGVDTTWISCYIYSLTEMTRVLLTIDHDHVEVDGADGGLRKTFTFL